MGKYEGQIGIRYEEIIVGRVIGVYPISADITEPADRRPRVDVFPLDGRAVFYKVPCSYQPGHIRNYRVGQHVVLGFRNGLSSAPLIIGHLFNIESNPQFQDNVPDAYQNVGDDVWYHPETGAFFRFRSEIATPLSGSIGDLEGTPPAAVSPCIAELTLASGATMRFTELPGGLCSYQVYLPSGASVYIDDLGDIQVTSPQTVTINASGNVAVIAGVNATVTAATQAIVNAPKIVINSTDVELGADTGKNASNGVVREQDELSNLTRFKAAMVAASVPNAPAIVVPTISASTQVFSE